MATKKTAVRKPAKKTATRKPAAKKPATKKAKTYSVVDSKGRKMNMKITIK